MAFNIGAGLSQMGQATSQFTGLAALEAQKSSLETEKLKIANDLAMQRESAGRQEAAALQTAENQRHEGFLAKEGEANRAAQLEGHRISAGSAAATAAAHLKGIQMQLDAQAAQGKFELGQDGVGYRVDLRSGKAEPIVGDDGKPRIFKDPEKTLATNKLLQVTHDDMTSLARQYELELRQATQVYQTLAKDQLAAVDPEKQKALKEAAAEVKAVQSKFEPKLDALRGRMRDLSEQLGLKSGIQTTGTIRYDAQGNRIEDEKPAPAGVPTGTATGIINMGGR